MILSKHRCLLPPDKREMIEYRGDVLLCVHQTSERGDNVVPLGPPPYLHFTNYSLIVMGSGKHGCESVGVMFV